jgi:hypothetical protein
MTRKLGARRPTTDSAPQPFIGSLGIVTVGSKIDPTTAIRIPTAWRSRQ